MEVVITICAKIPVAVAAASCGRAANHSPVDRRSSCSSFVGRNNISPGRASIGSDSQKSWEKGCWDAAILENEVPLGVDSPRKQRHVKKKERHIRRSSGSSNGSVPINVASLSGNAINPSLARENRALRGKMRKARKNVRASLARARCGGAGEAPLANRRRAHRAQKSTVRGRSEAGGGIAQSAFGPKVCGESRDAARRAKAKSISTQREASGYGAHATPRAEKTCQRSSACRGKVRKAPQELLV